MNGGAHNDAAHHVDERDQKARNGVTAYKFGGTVHGAEKRAFLLQITAALFSGVFIDQSGGEVGVDGHLFAGHGVQRKAGRHFGDTARTFGDHNKVHDDQNGKNDDTRHHIAAHQEVAKGLNNAACGSGACVPVRQNKAC